MSFQKRVAYFTPEVAVHNDFHNYAGGQGVVAGGHLKAAAEMGLPMVGVSILWRCGYYDQILGPNGMEINYVPRYYEDILVDSGIKVKVQVGGSPNTLIKVWLLKPEVYGTVPIILLDTDIEENDHLSRTITQAVYSGVVERRLAQRIVLGIGGVKALQALQIPEVDIYHLNEGETFGAAIALISQKMSEGLTFEEGLNWAREHIVSTIHTPELSANQSYNIGLLMWLGCLLNLNYQQAVYLAGEPFHPTVSLLKTSKAANAVSQLHRETTKQMFSGIEGKCKIIPITNGVVDDFWQPPKFQGDKTAQEIRRAKTPYKREVCELVKKRSGKIFQEDVLTIGTAGRWAEYKRMDLIFRDLPWFEKLLSSGKVQVILAGKPHPEDQMMVDLWNNAWRMSQKLPNLAILEDYELEMMRLLRIGCDAWLKTPRRPQEACSTSGMSTAGVGTMSVSSRDGWLATEEHVGYRFGVEQPLSSKEEQDRIDGEDLKRCIIEELVEDFYKNPRIWGEKILTAKKIVEQDYSAKRMVKDYVFQLYGEG